MAAAKSKIDLKVVLLGAHSTGKTSLVNRYLHNEFDDKQVMVGGFCCLFAVLIGSELSDLSVEQTVGAAFGSKCIDVQGRSFVLGIWVCSHVFGSFCI
jgi:GTPase SAR1 family protein